MESIIRNIKKVLKACLPYGIIVLIRKYQSKKFFCSSTYWEKRYVSGGNSGAGSYNFLAGFKAEIINNFIETGGGVQTVIEFGCGDGNQLLLAQYPHYIGFDISQSAITRCKNLFQNDKNKSFYTMDQYKGEKADMVLSLDVIYHLIEDNIFEKYMQTLFDAAKKYIIIYSSNDEFIKYFVPSTHIKHRKFTNWIQENIKDWNLKVYIPNRYPYKGNHVEGSFADFFIYEKK